MFQERLGEYRWKNATFPGSLSACLGLCIHIKRHVFEHRSLYTYKQHVAVFIYTEASFMFPDKDSKDSRENRSYFWVSFRLYRFVCTYKETCFHAKKNSEEAMENRSLAWVSLHIYRSLVVYKETCFVCRDGAQKKLGGCEGMQVMFLSLFSHIWVSLYVERDLLYVKTDLEDARECKSCVWASIDIYGSLCTYKETRFVYKESLREYKLKKVTF